MYKELSQSLLNRQMTRKEFLMHIMLVFIALFGISNIVNILKDPASITRRKATTGFGSGPYGA